MLIKKILRDYYPIIILILFVFANSIPDIYIPFLRNSYAKRFPEMWAKEPNNGKYSPLVVVGPGTGSWAADEVRTASKVVEFLRNGKPYDLYPKENKYSIYWIQDFVSFGILAVIQKAIGNITKTWIVSEILFTFLWLILIYIICRQFKLPKLYSIFCSVSTFFFGNIFSVIYYNFPDLYITIVKSINNFFLIDFTLPPSAYSRLPNPLLSYSFIFIAILLLIKFYLPENNNSDRNVKIGYFKSILYGIFIGSIAYIHPFEWLFTLIVIFFVMVFLWFYKFKKISFNIFISLITASLISLPLISLHLFSETSFENYGVIFTRVPDYKSIIFLIIIYLVWYFYKKKNLLDFRQYLLFFTIGISSFVLQNLQVLIGVSIQREHWSSISCFFVALLVLLIIGNYCVKKILKNSFSILSLMLILVSLVLAVNKGLIFSQNNYKVMGLPKSYEKAFDWLKSNTPKNSVVGTVNVELGDLLPLYTDNIPYVAVNFPNSSHITLDENIKRYVDLLEVIKINKEKLKDNLKIWDNEYISKHASAYLHKFLLNQEVSRTDYEIKSFGNIIIGGSYKLIKKSNLKKLNNEIFNINEKSKDLKIPQYELSYLLIEHWTKQFMPDELDYPLLYDTDDIKIYKLKNNQ